MRIGVAHDQLVDVLGVSWTELKTLSLAAHIPDQVCQKRARVIIAADRTVIERTIEPAQAIREFDPFGIIKMPMHARARCLGQPWLKIFKNLSKALENGIRCRCHAVFPPLAWKAALHI